MPRRKKPPSPNELVFKIDGLTPKTMPIDRLAKYLERFAEMVGNESNVHLLSVDNGSCVLRAVADTSALPKIRDRANSLNDNTAPRNALKAKKDLDELLAADNTSGRVSLGGVDLILIDGNKRSSKEELGPIARPTTMDGAIWQIGGRDETINVHLRDHGVDLKCVVSIELAKRLTPYLFGAKVRLIGIGQWYRVDGKWCMKNLVADDFVQLDESRLESSVERIRGLLADVSPDDFLDTMEELRQG